MLGYFMVLSRLFTQAAFFMNIVIIKLSNVQTGIL